MDCTGDPCICESIDSLSNVFKEKRSPEAAITPEKWKREASLTIWGVAIAGEKQLGGTTAGASCLPPGTRVLIHPGVRNNILTEKCHES